MTTILVTSASYIFTDYLLSSEGNSCYNIFKHLGKYGYRFEAISAKVKIKEPLENVVLHQVGNFQASPMAHIFEKYLSHTEFLARSLFKSLEILKKQRIDIIHHMLPAVYNQTFSLLALLKKTKKYPFVFGPVSTHFFPRPIDEKVIEKITSKLHIKTINNCDRIIAITEYVKKLYTKIFDPEKIITIPLGVDTNFFKPSKKRPDKKGRELLFVGYLYKLKGTEFLIRAMHLIIHECKDVKLRIVGDGPEKRNLMKLAQILNIQDRVIFQGFVPHWEMPKYYQNCDIFCFPTLGEPFGKVIVEAMACAKPVVASNIGGPAEIIQHQKTGILVQPAQPKLLAQKILSLLNDEKAMKTMGLNARKTVLQKYSWQKIAEKYHELYKSFI